MSRECHALGSGSFDGEYFIICEDCPLIQSIDAKHLTIKGLMKCNDSAEDPVIPKVVYPDQEKPDIV